MSDAVFGKASKLGSLSSKDIKLLKRVRFDEGLKALKIKQIDGEERDLTEEEKK